MILFPIIIAVLVAYWFYQKSVPPIVGRRRIVLFILRSISFIVIMIFLFNPILNFIQKKTSFPKIIFLRDISESMDQKGIEHNKSEAFNLLRDQLKAKYSGLDYDLQEFDFAAGLSGSSSNTELTRTLQELTIKEDLSAAHSIFLLSDGWLKDENLDILNELDLPLNVVNPDFNFNDFDLEISNLHYNKSVYKDEISPIQINVTGSNYRGTAQIDLIIDDQIKASQKLNFNKSDFLEVNFENTFENIGLQNFEIAIHPDYTGEINTANNTFPAAVQVLENRLKCLIVTDKITWDESYIIDVLQVDSNWEAVLVLKQDQFKKERETIRLQSELNDASILVLANHSNLQLSRQNVELITRFVSSGGSVFSYGKLIKNLSQILPVVPSNLTQQFSSQFFFTEESQKYQTFRFNDQNVAADIPPIDYYYVLPKRQAQILAKISNDQSSSAILFHSFEKGKVIHFAFENLWKWQLRTSDDRYRQFMNNLINWIGRKASDRLIVQTDKNSYFAGESINISVVAYDEKLIPITDLSAKFSLFDETNSSIYSEYLLAENNEYTLQLRDLDTGKYQYQVEDPTFGLEAKGKFIVSANNPESRDRGINSSLLTYIAERTGGEIITSKSIDNYIIERADLVNVENRKEIQLYRKWYLIAIFLISFCTELFLRKRWGLL